MASTKLTLAASTTLTISLHTGPLASSSTLVAGRSSTEIDNSTNLHLDKIISGKISVGTTPTASTVIEVWLIPKREDSSYHDTFDGTDKNVTVTSRSHLLGYGTLLALLSVPAATSNVAYEFSKSIAAALGTNCPAKFQIFVVHNTGVALNSTSGNHALYEKGTYTTTV